MTQKDISVKYVLLLINESKIQIGLENIFGILLHLPPKTLLIGQCMVQFIMWLMDLDYLYNLILKSALFYPDYFMTNNERTIA